MILTTLSDYAKQKGITRARAYQLQSKLSLIYLPVYAINKDGTRIPLYKDGNALMQTYVQQERTQLENELAGINLVINDCTGRDYNRLDAMRKMLITILK